MQSRYVSGQPDALTLQQLWSAARVAAPSASARVTTPPSLHLPTFNRVQFMSDLMSQYLEHANRLEFIVEL